MIRVRSELPLSPRVKHCVWSIFLLGSIMAIAGLFVRFLSNLAALWLASRLVDGFSVSGQWQGYAISAAILTILNLVVKPVLKFFSAPLIILTLGLLGFIINVIIIWLAAQLTTFMTVDGLQPLIWVTVIVSITNLLFHK